MKLLWPGLLVSVVAVFWLFGFYWGMGALAAYVVTFPGREIPAGWSEQAQWHQQRENDDNRTLCLWLIGAITFFVFLFSL